MKQFLQYWPVLLVVLQLLAVWACWSLRQLAKNEITAATAKLEAKDEEIGEDVREQDRRLSRAEGHIAELRDDIENLPTKADLARLEGEVKVVNSNVEAARDGIKRIEGYFLERGVERA